MSEGKDTLTTEQVERILIRHLRQEGYTSQEAADITGAWFATFATAIINDLADMVEEEEVAQIVRPRLQEAQTQTVQEGKIAFSNLILEISLDGFSEHQTFQMLADEDGEMGSGDFINHLVTTYEVTFEFARDALMELIRQRRLELTPSYKLRLPATT